METLTKICTAGDLPRKLKYSLIGFAVLSVVVDGYVIGINYLSVSGYGDWGVVSEELVSWLCLLGFLLMAVASAGMLLDKLRCASFAMLLGSLMFVTLTLGSLKLSDRIRYRGLERLTMEAAPLVEAIKSYEKAHGSPPRELSDLTITYPEGFEIKGGALPEFEYFSGYLVEERYHGNPWVLILQTPTGPMRWDTFMYYPLQNYPSLGHGGWLEPIRGWAYVHD